MSNWSTKRSIRIFKNNFNRWLNKSSRSFKSPQEGELIKLFRKIIYLETSKCFIDVYTGKRYIENKDKNILVVLFDYQIDLIQNKLINSSFICINTFNILCEIFDTKLSKERVSLEDKYMNKAEDFINNVNRIINIK